MLPLMAWPNANPEPNAIKLSRASPNAKTFNLETTDCIRFLLKLKVPGVSK
jgi:hypothetical protein